MPVEILGGRTVSGAPTPESDSWPQREFRRSARDNRWMREIESGTLGFVVAAASSGPLRRIRWTSESEVRLLTTKLAARMRQACRPRVAIARSRLERRGFGRSEGRARGLTIRLQELDEESRWPTSQGEGKQGTRRKIQRCGRGEELDSSQRGLGSSRVDVCKHRLCEWRASRVAVAQADAEWGALEIERRRSGSQKRRL